MARVGELVTIQSDAARRASLPPAASARPSPAYRVLAEIDDLAILQRVTAAPSGSRLRMAGEIASETSVLEAINMVATNGWRGELIVQGTDSLRRIRIDHGAVKSAFSEVAAEELGRIMVALGMLSAEQLAHASQALGPDDGLGERLMQLGLVTRERLFNAVCFQAERIFQNALLVTQGFLAFVDAPAAGRRATLTMHIPVQGLVMKSVQRIDEMAFFRAQIPSGEVCPVATPAASRQRLEGALAEIASLADGNHSILQIAARLGVDEFAITKAVAHLLQQGAVRLIEREQLDPQQAGERITRFNEVLRCIREAVERHGGSDEMRWTLEAWMRDTTLGEFFGAELEPDGGVPIATTIERLSRMRLERPMQRLDHALHELVSFAMFSATPVLSPAEAQALTSQVAERLEQVRPQTTARRTQFGVGPAP